jgi:hypothetical protein
MTETSEQVYEATVGRQEFLRRSNFSAVGMAWLQTQALQVPSFPPAPDADVRRGYDFLYTHAAFQRIRIPGELLGQGMESFDQIVRFDGAPLSKNTGNADTIMERLEDASFGQRIQTRLVGFGNVSHRPIELRGTGPMAGLYTLFVTLSPSMSSPGSAIYYSQDESGDSGWANSEISLAPLFELRPLDGRESIFIDTGRTALPGFPMDLVSDSGAWQRHPVSPQDVQWDMAGQSLFWPEMLYIIARSRDPRRDGAPEDYRTDAQIKSDIRNFVEHIDEGRDMNDAEEVLRGVQAACAKITATA